MQLENRFTIPVGAEQAWDLLLDVRRVIPCFPGAAVTAVSDDTIDGSVRIKLGPVLLHYAGTATFQEKDAAAHRVVLTAQGSDRKGGGSAAATITAALRAQDQESTECLIVTDLDITGRPAQFGRGIMTEVGNRITDQFAANLSTMLAAATDDAGKHCDVSPEAGVASQVAGEPAAGDTARAGSAPDALDLLSVARGAAAKRLLPIVAALVVVIVASVVARRSARASSPSNPGRGCDGAAGGRPRELLTTRR